MPLLHSVGEGKEALPRTMDRKIQCCILRHSAFALIEATEVIDTLSVENISIDNQRQPINDDPGNRQDVRDTPSRYSPFDAAIIYDARFDSEVIGRRVIVNFSGSAANMSTSSGSISLHKSASRHPS